MTDATEVLTDEELEVLRAAMASPSVDRRRRLHEGEQREREDNRR